RVSLGGLLPDLRDLRVRPDLIVAKQGTRVAVLGFPFGEGRVTVVPRLAFLGNYDIGKLDHARFGWRLAAAEQPGRVVTLFTKMESPPFLDCVSSQAWAVVLGATLVVAALLSLIVP